MARITKAQWDEYAKTLAKTHERAVRMMDSWFKIHADEPFEEGIKYACKVASKYSKASGTLAAELYDAIAVMQGRAVPPAEIFGQPTYGQLAKACKKAASNAKFYKRAEAVSETAGGFIKRTGMETILGNVKRDGIAEFAWVPSGDSCAFCQMLASNGWRKASDLGDHELHVHTNCNCTYAVRFSDSLTLGGYEPEKYRRRYNAAEGDTWQEKINSMRRDEYAKHKDEINEQKREAYARRMQNHE